MKRYLLVTSAALLLAGCVSTSYEYLATQAGVRVSAVHGELVKVAQSSRLASQDRAHYVALLDEAARKLQIEADRELVSRQALDIKGYPLLVQTLRWDTGSTCDTSGAIQKTAPALTFARIRPPSRRRTTVSRPSPISRVATAQMETCSWTTWTMWTMTTWLCSHPSRSSACTLPWMVEQSIPW